MSSEALKINIDYKNKRGHTDKKNNKSESVANTYGFPEKCLYQTDRVKRRMMQMQQRKKLLNEAVIDTPPLKLTYQEEQNEKIKENPKENNGKKKKENKIIIKQERENKSIEEENKEMVKDSKSKEKISMLGKSVSEKSEKTNTTGSGKLLREDTNSNTKTDLNKKEDNLINDEDIEVNISNLDCEIDLNDLDNNSETMKNNSTLKDDSNLAEGKSKFKANSAPDISLAGLQKEKQNNNNNLQIQINNPCIPKYFPKSFIPLNNNLKAKVSIEKNKNSTNSYLLALFPDLEKHPSEKKSSYKV
ncbi:MAG: hypothetical protein MJ252_27090, partial [archaeon]|nr:hypothetical protein [archaeon]